jgi:hypothetical protein
MEKKFYTHFKDGKIIYRMVDEKSKVSYQVSNSPSFDLYTKYKDCSLVLYSKDIIALNPDVDKTYGYKYIYQIVEDPNKNFKKISVRDVFIDADDLIGEYLSTIKDN